jgi:hypothetical protein
MTETVPAQEKQKIRRYWTKLEDDLLLAAVSTVKDGDWVSIAKLVPDRDNRQCAERYKFLINGGKQHRTVASGKLRDLAQLFPGVIYERLLSRTYMIDLNSLLEDSILENAIVISLEKLIIEVVEQIVPGGYPRVAPALIKRLQPSLAAPNYLQIISSVASNSDKIVSRVGNALLSQITSRTDINKLLSSSSIELQLGRIKFESAKEDYEDLKAGKPLKLRTYKCRVDFADIKMAIGFISDLSGQIIPGKLRNVRISSNYKLHNVP